MPYPGTHPSGAGKRQFQGGDSKEWLVHFRTTACATAERPWRQHQTVKALLDRKLVSAEGLNHVFSALGVMYKNGSDQEFPFLKTLIEAGAQVNADRILDDVAETNAYLVSTLISLGADVKGGWHQRRQMLSCPLYSVLYMSREVFDMLIAHGADVNFHGDHGFTPLLKLMNGVADIGGRYPRYSEAVHAESFRWLVGAGASCLIRDDHGSCLSDTSRGRTPFFRGLIENAIRDENWGGRRGFVLLRCALFPDESQVKHSKPDVAGCNSLVLHVTIRPCFGVFRNVVSYM